MTDCAFYMKTGTCSYGACARPLFCLALPGQRKGEYCVRKRGHKHGHRHGHTDADTDTHTVAHRHTQTHERRHSVRVCWMWDVYVVSCLRWSMSPGAAV
eukprot:3307348-Rhodomonas_salina.1